MSSRPSELPLASSSMFFISDFMVFIFREPSFNFYSFIYAFSCLKGSETEGELPSWGSSPTCCCPLCTPVSQGWGWASLKPGTLNLLPPPRGSQGPGSISTIESLLNFSKPQNVIINSILISCFATFCVNLSPVQPSPRSTPEHHTTHFLLSPFCVCQSACLGQPREWNPKLCDPSCLPLHAMVVFISHRVFRLFRVGRGACCTLLVDSAPDGRTGLVNSALWSSAGVVRLWGYTSSAGADAVRTLR